MKSLPNSKNLQTLILQDELEGQEGSEKKLVVGIWALRRQANNGPAVPGYHLPLVLHEVLDGLEECGEHQREDVWAWEEREYTSRYIP